MVWGIVVVVVSMLEEENMVCEVKDKVVFVFIMNGISDFVNLYDGGEVNIYGLVGCGFVCLIDEMVDYFCFLEVMGDMVLDIG